MPAFVGEKLTPRRLKPSVFVPRRMVSEIERSLIKVYLRCPCVKIRASPLTLEHVRSNLSVLAGPVPATYVLAALQGCEDVDARPSRMFPTWANYNCRSREHPTSDDKRGHYGGDIDSIGTKPALTKEVARTTTLRLGSAGASRTHRAGRNGRSRERIQGRMSITAEHNTRYQTRRASIPRVVCTNRW
jgi:hypothetical protein